METKTQKQKIQLVLNNKQAIELYQVFKHGTRTLMIEQAIILLAQNETMRNLFLDEYDKMKVDDILASAKLVEKVSSDSTEDEDNIDSKESNESVQQQNSQEQQKNNTKLNEPAVSIGW
ncbi:MAG: hypothetical protein U9Q66_01845 [Patescibacteria group bacterium]|nr:hypothetical protein [Patescibacteria group bacterium]